MAPELINRLDDILVFHPLSPEAISDIARHEIDAALRALIERGCRLEVGDDVVALVSSAGYDPEFGARHLQRNIERLLLTTLIDHDGLHLRAGVVGADVLWQSLPGAKHVVRFRGAARRSDDDPLRMMR